MCMSIILILFVRNLIRYMTDFEFILTKSYKNAEKLFK
jgi:hypothetical protein